MSSSATARTSGFVGMAGMLQPQQQAAEFVEQVGKEILPLLQLSKQYVVREGEWTGRPAEITVFEVAPNTDSGALVPTASQADARQFYSKITTWKGQVTMVRGGALLPMDQQQNEYGPEFTQQTVREAGIAAALSVEMDALLRMREPYTPLLKSVVHGPTSALAPTVATAYRAMQEIGVGMFNGPSGDTELLWRNYVTLNRLVETMRSQARAAGAVVDFIIGAESLSEWLGGDRAEPRRHDRHAGDVRGALRAAGRACPAAALLDRPQGRPRHPAQHDDPHHAHRHVHRAAQGDLHARRPLGVHGAGGGAYSAR